MSDFGGFDEYKYKKANYFIIILPHDPTLPKATPTNSIA